MGNNGAVAESVAAGIVNDIIGSDFVLIFIQAIFCKRDAAGKTE